jgi:hypothetical protein
LFARSCIDRPPRGARMASKALHATWRRSTHLVVLDGYAARRKLGRCRSRLSHIPKTYAEGAGSSESNPAPPRPDPLRVWARIAWSFGYYGGCELLFTVREDPGSRISIHRCYKRYWGGVEGGAWRGGFQGYRGGAMQDLGYELRRISIPRTWVNGGSAGNPLP